MGRTSWLFILGDGLRERLRYIVEQPLPQELHAVLSRLNRGEKRR